MMKDTQPKKTDRSAYYKAYYSKKGHEGRTICGTGKFGAPLKQNKPMTQEKKECPHGCPWEHQESHWHYKNMTQPQEKNKCCMGGCGNVNCEHCQTHCPKSSLQQEQKKKIGMLRQWLNEDRITDPKKMVTNEDIEYWLTR